MKIALTRTPRNERLAGAGHGCPRTRPQRLSRPIRLRQDDARRPGDPRALRPAVRSRSRRPSEHPAAPQGEVVVDNRGKHYRLRRSHDEAAGERLTVAALDQSAVDQETVRQLVACLSPTLLRPLFAVSFREPPQLDWLLSPEFSHEFRAAMWRLKWAPPTVDAELRPIYARLRALEIASDVARARTRHRRSAAPRPTPRLAPARGIAGHRTILDAAHRRRARATANRQRHRRGTRRDPRTAIRSPVESLWSTQRDQVYLSLCLALVSACAGTASACRWCSTSRSHAWTPRSSAALVDSARAISATADTRCWCSPPATKRRSEVRQREPTCCTMQATRVEHGVAANAGNGRRRLHAAFAAA